MTTSISVQLLSIFFFSRHLELLGCVSPEYPFMLMEATTYSVVFFVSHMIIFSHYSTIFFLIPLCSLFGFEGKKNRLSPWEGTARLWSRLLSLLHFLPFLPSFSFFLSFCVL